ncbi:MULTISPECIES: DUF2243 domain-containing protein [unclassified Leifsonia]|uniref:DUF2243 domain-containing protein n=1 Tax=unclassified Leifsonia TaxID=2663824 RepID=UPI0006F581E5|nr:MULTISPECIES: DUF2243 domain-containing protein [unclassified Leifsonia]KQX06909.1 hypothetical protein ASC59_03540 [Leifsonia sp. Root1293]KRA11194.1 hypothetical protein ASD61_03540 [Leifsonia sp. Root60]
MSTETRRPLPGAPSSGRKARAERSAQNAWSGILFGVGLVAFIDETVFHQILHWHHFYDLGTPDLGLISDGLFHAVSWFATIGGLFLLADLRRRGALHWGRWWGGVLLGAGAFQLYDGTVQHKLLGIHQIRYVEDTLPYDLTWNVIAVAMVVVGIVMLARTRTSAVPTRGDRVGSGS